MTGGDCTALLAEIPLFAGLPPDELAHLSATLPIRTFEAGALLIREGERDERLYILLDGEVEAIKALETPDERLLAVQGRGSVYGEMSLFNPEGRHTASVRTCTTTCLLELTSQEFDALLHRHPSLAYEMMRLLSRRLEESENTTILDLREKNRQLAEAYEDLKSAQAQVVAKEKLEKELAIAREIQASILPDALPRLAGFEIAALTVPARAVGGDYYDFVPLGDDRFGVVVGDACDKGIAAALFINLTNSLVHAEAPRSASPEAALRQVNRHLVAMNRSSMFATLLYGVLDASGQFDYCRAGHPHPLVLDAARRPLALEAKPGLPLGILDDVQLDARRLTIPPGGLVALYSDGLSDVLESSAESGAVRLAVELAALAPLPADQITAGLAQRVAQVTGDQPQFDDFTVVVIKRAP